jgi:MFS family permease
MVASRQRPVNGRREAEDMGSGPLTNGSSEPINLATRFIMLAGGVVVMMALSAVTPVLPQIEAALATTANERLMVKMLVTVIGFTMVIGAPLTGFLTDRLGFRRPLILASIVYTLAGTAGLYLSDIYALLASRLLVGLAAASIATMAMTLINTRLEGVDRARWMGFHISTAMFGSLLVHPLIGAFAIFSFGLVIGIVALVGLKEVPVAARAPAAIADAPAESGNPLRWFPLWFIPLALVMGTVTYIPNVYLPFVVKETGVVSPAIIASVMLGDALIGACMSLLFGRSQRYLSSEAAFMVSFGCVGMGMLIVSLSSTLVGIIGGMLVFGFGLGWFVPNLMYSLSKRVTKARQGRAVGIVKAAHYIAAPLGILAVEPVSRAAGPHGVMLTGAILSFCALAVFAGMTLRRGGRAPAVAQEAVAAE